MIPAVINHKRHQMTAKEWVVSNYITETPLGGRIDGSSDVLKELCGDGLYRNASERQLIQRGQREGYERSELIAAVRHIIHVSGSKFSPNQSPLFECSGSFFHNTWHRPAVVFSGKLISEEPKLFGDFMDRWFMKTEERTFFINWLAATICRPTWQVSMAVLLRSSQGTGKGCLWDTVVAPLCGEGNAKTMTLKQAMNDYAGFIYDSSALYVNEVYSDKKSAADKLKKLITDRTAVKNQKYKTQEMTDVNLNIFIDSNSKYPLYIEQGDRRYWVPEYIDHRVDQKETANWLNDVFVPWVTQEGGLQEIRDHLETIALGLSESQFQRAPDTEAKYEIAAQDSTEDYETELREFLLERRMQFKFTPTTLQNEKFTRINKNIITAIMRELEFDQYKRGSGVGRKLMWEHKDLRTKKGANPLPWSRDNERKFERSDNANDTVSTDGWPKVVADVWKSISQGNACVSLDDPYLWQFIKENHLWDQVAKVRDYPDRSVETLIRVFRLKGKVLFCCKDTLNHGKYLVNLANQIVEAK